MSTDESSIRCLIENWALWRDTGAWDEFSTLWAPDGRMVATWFTGPAAEFIAAGKAAMGRGAMAHHVLGGSTVRVTGARAIAQTRMTLHLRMNVHGLLCDITCLGRFFDFLERNDNSWQLVLRQPIYDKDRIDTVDPQATLSLDPALLSQFPSGYQHVAYAQTKAGMSVNLHLPGIGGAPVEPIIAMADRWLSGVHRDELR